MADAGDVDARGRNGGGGRKCSKAATVMRPPPAAMPNPPQAPALVPLRRKPGWVPSESGVSWVPLASGLRGWPRGKGRAVGAMSPAVGASPRERWEPTYCAQRRTLRTDGQSLLPCASPCFRGPLPSRRPPARPGSCGRRAGPACLSASALTQAARERGAAAADAGTVCIVTCVQASACARRRLQPPARHHRRPRPARPRSLRTWPTNRPAPAYAAGLRARGSDAGCKKRSRKRTARSNRGGEGGAPDC